MIIDNKIKLRAKKLSDARNDYRWQTDPWLTKLDATPLLSISFPQYLLDYTDQMYYLPPTSHRFAIENSNGKHIGNCGYYNVNEAAGEAELGIIIGARNYWDKGYGTDAVTTLVTHIFLDTNLMRIYLKTLDWNERAQLCFQKCGFAPCGYLSRDGYRFVVMELHRKQWEEQRRKKDE